MTPLDLVTIVVLFVFGLIAGDIIFALVLDLLSRRAERRAERAARAGVTRTYCGLPECTEHRWGGR